jgi:hypothetical protein
MAKIKGFLCKCDVCQYEWKPRSEGLPVRCAKCKSPYWNIPKKGKGGRG